MKEKFAFIIMPFAQEYTQAYTDIIQPAVIECGIECVRADEDSQGNIHNQMMDRIFNADILITDITGLNPNVFYELGVAHTISKKTIVVCNGDKMDKVPFDIAPYRILTYKLDDSKTEYTEQLQEEIKSIVNENAKGIPNPVQDYLAEQTPLNSKTSLFINELSSDIEKSIFELSTKKIVFFGLTGSSFSDIIVSLVEKNDNKSFVEVQLALLNPKATESWEFIYKMRFGKEYKKDLLTKYLTRDTINQEHAIENFEMLTKKFSDFKFTINYYDMPPVFWGYGIDDAKWIIGQYAVGKTNSRNFPINVLVKEDISTRFLFNYYKETIDEILNDN